MNGRHEKPARRDFRMARHDDALVVEAGRARFLLRRAAPARDGRPLVSITVEAPTGAHATAVVGLGSLIALIGALKEIVGSFKGPQSDEREPSWTPLVTRLGRGRTEP